MDFSLDYFERVRERTMRVLACVPPEQIEWTYSEGKFTIGDIARHLAAIERWMFAENAMLRPSAYDGHKPDAVRGLEGVLSYMRDLHGESMAIFRSLTDEQLRERCITPGGAQIPVWKWLRSMIEHEIHHRGQIYLYLSMLGVETPPLYGLTEEQVAAKAVRG